MRRRSQRGKSDRHLILDLHTTVKIKADTDVDLLFHPLLRPRPVSLLRVTQSAHKFKTDMCVRHAMHRIREAHLETKKIQLGGANSRCIYPGITQVHVCITPK